MTQVQWIIVTLTVLLLFVVIGYGAYSGTVQAAIDQLTDFISRGNQSASDALDDPAPSPGDSTPGTAAPIGPESNHVTRPISRPLGG